MEEETPRAGGRAVEGGALAIVTAARLGAELRLLAGEPMPSAMCGLEASGSGPSCSRASPSTRPGRARPAPDAARRAGGPCGARRLPVDASAPALAARLDAFEFTAASATPSWPPPPAHGRSRRCSAARGRPAIWTLLRREAPETVALAGALGAAEAARLWLQQLRHRKLAITGDDLLAEGLEGPAIGRALDAATAAMLDGEAEGREAQLAAALAAPPE